MKRWLWMSACVLALTLGPDARAQPVERSAVGDPRCVLLCVAILQAIGDDMKEQIYLLCNQATGACEGSGHIQTLEERVPILVTTNLEGDILHVWMKGAADTFAAEGADHIAMTIAPNQLRQTGQFVVQRIPAPGSGRPAGTTPLVVTVMVEKLITP